MVVVNPFESDQDVVFVLPVLAFALMIVGSVETLLGLDLTLWILIYLISLSTVYSIHKLVEERLDDGTKVYDKEVFKDVFDQEVSSLLYYSMSVSLGLVVVVMLLTSLGLMSVDYSEIGSLSAFTAITVALVQFLFLIMSVYRYMLREIVSDY